MAFIQTRDKQSIYVRDIGPKSKSTQVPIFLLHGFGMHSAHWLPFALPLATKHRFIIPDLRGFGRSHRLAHNEACVITNYAHDLADIVEYFGFKQIKLAGISMGAFVALKYQALYGDQHISRYLHIDQSPKCLNSSDWQWGLFGHEQDLRLTQARTLLNKLEPFLKNKSPYDTLPENLRVDLWKNLGDFFASAMSKTRHKKIAQYLCNQESLIKHLIPVENWASYVYCLKAYLEQDYDMINIVKKLSAPMSLMVGLRSEMYPCGGQLRIADYHPKCEIITLNRSGHTPLIDQPLRFLKELKRFAQT